MSKQYTPESNISVLVMDLYTYAVNINDIIGSYLVEPAIGLYYKTRTTPSLIEGKTYYYLNGNEYYCNGLYTSMESDLYDDTGKRVFSHSEFLKGNYSDITFEPIIGIKLIVSILKEQLVNSVCHNHVPGYDHTEYLKDPTTEDYVVPIVENKIYQLIRDLNNFINSDYWNTYDVRLIGSVFYMFKQTDYRILEWYRITNEGKTKQE